MKKIIVALTLALIVSCIFTVTPARAEATAVEEAAAEVIEVIQGMLPEETQLVGRIAFWMGAMSSCDTGAGTIKRSLLLSQVLNNVGVSEQKIELAEAMFRLGAVSADEVNKCDEIAADEEEDGQQAFNVETFCDEKGDCSSVITVVAD